ncbi:hypothetical protein BN126360115 [Stenotrophomonas indicatrix]|nr:hypothetical protein BN126360115 [Stenotrophomonas indicatrix]
MQRRGLGSRECSDYRLTLFTVWQANRNDGTAALDGGRRSGGNSGGAGGNLVGVPGIGPDSSERPDRHAAGLDRTDRAAGRRRSSG